MLLQDVKRIWDSHGDDDAGGGVNLKGGVSKDRMVSVHDSDMRRGHKSKRHRFDGHKADVAVDIDTQSITAVDVLPGNAGDSGGALELVEQSEASAGVPLVEAMGDTAGGDGAPVRSSSAPGNGDERRPREKGSARRGTRCGR